MTPCDFKHALAPNDFHRVSLLPNLATPKGLDELIKREKDPFTINDFLQVSGHAKVNI